MFSTSKTFKNPTSQTEFLEFHSFPQESFHTPDENLLKLEDDSALFGAVVEKPSFFHSFQRFFHIGKTLVRQATNRFSTVSTAPSETAFNNPIFCVY